MVACVCARARVYGVCLLVILRRPFKILVLLFRTSSPRKKKPRRLAGAEVGDNRSGYA